MTYMTYMTYYIRLIIHTYMKLHIHVHTTCTYIHTYCTWHGTHVIRMCTCTTQYHGHCPGCLRGCWSQNWLSLFKWSLIIDFVMVLVHHLHCTALDQKKWNPRLNILHLNLELALQINHVNPCRVPKNSVVIILCVLVIIYMYIKSTYVVNE
jgi:hypothetical protein